MAPPRGRGIGPRKAAGSARELIRAAAAAPLDLSVNTNLCRATWRGEEFTLAAQQARMLNILIRHRGRVVTLEWLSTALITRREGEPLTNTHIHVVMSLLRNALEVRGCRIIVEAVFGVGYVFHGAVDV